jgi:hypothetical protein
VTRVTCAPALRCVAPQACERQAADAQEQRRRHRRRARGADGGHGGCRGCCAERGNERGGARAATLGCGNSGAGRSRHVASPSSQHTHACPHAVLCCALLCCCLVSPCTHLIADAACPSLTPPGDPATASRLQRNDFYRLERALEIVRATGRPVGAFAADASHSPFDFRCACCDALIDALMRRCMHAHKCTQVHPHIPLAHHTARACACVRILLSPLSDAQLLPLGGAAAAVVPPN